MKKVYFFCILPLFFITGCGGSSNTGGKYHAPITNITGETVFDKDGNETTINGEVSINYGKTIFGTIENGKLNLDLSSLEVSENNLKRDEWAGFPDVKIKPMETRWYFLRSSLFVSTGEFEEVESIWQPITENAPVEMETNPINYDLSLKATPQDVEAQLVYFSNDATIQAKGNLGAVAWDINIQAKKGWNMVYTIKAKNSQTANIIVSTSAKNVNEVRWVAKR